MHLQFDLLVAITLAAGALAPRTPIVARTLLEQRAPADSVREYRGFYESGWEASWFHPCDATPGDDTWWVTLTDAALHQRDSLASALPARPPGPVFVRWRGTTSIKMQAGHMGRGTRYMLVSEVLQIRPAADASCAAT
jgi:hypothetical protein